MCLSKLLIPRKQFWVACCQIVIHAASWFRLIRTFHECSRRDCNITCWLPHILPTWQSQWHQWGDWPHPQLIWPMKWREGETRWCRSRRRWWVHPCHISLSSSSFVLWAVGISVGRTYHFFRDNNIYNDIYIQRQIGPRLSTNIDPESNGNVRAVPSSLRPGRGTQHDTGTWNVTCLAGKEPQLV